MSQYDSYVRPKNKCRSLWPLFHGPVILPYIFKTFWYMNIIFQDNESVWPDIWSQNKCRSLWPTFHGPVIFLYLEDSLIYEHLTFVIMSQYESMFNLKINIGHCDLYFIVHWFCLISSRLFDIWTSYIRIMSQYDQTFDLKINVGHCDQYFVVQ